VTGGEGELPMADLDRKVVLQHGIYTVERDARGRYWLLLPDGRADQGLTADDLGELARALRKIARMERIAKKPAESGGGARTDAP